MGDKVDESELSQKYGIEIDTTKKLSTSIKDIKIQHGDSETNFSKPNMGQNNIVPSIKSFVSHKVSWTNQ